jgi:hypothetical protein
MSTTSLPSLLPPPATVTTVVVRLRDSSAERFGFVFLGFVIGVVFTVVVRWVHGLYLSGGSPHRHRHPAAGAGRRGGGGGGGSAALPPPLLIAVPALVGKAASHVYVAARLIVAIDQLNRSHLLA